MCILGKAFYLLIEFLRWVPLGYKLSRRSWNNAVFVQLRLLTITEVERKKSSFQASEAIKLRLNSYCSSSPWYICPPCSEETEAYLGSHKHFPRIPMPKSVVWCLLWIAWVESMTFSPGTKLKTGILILFSLLTYTALYWCILSFPFCNYSLSSLISQ